MTVFDKNDFLRVGAKLEITVWPSEQHPGLCFESQILQINAENRFLIQAPLSQEAAYLSDLAPGKPVGVVLIRATDSPILFYATVAEVRPAKPAEVWLNCPNAADIEVVQRRQYARVSLRIPVFIHYASLDGSERTEEGQMMDLSAGGMRFFSRIAFPSGLRTRARFQPERTGPTLDLAFVPLASRLLSTQNIRSTLYATNGYFEGMTEKQTQSLLAMCFRIDLHRAAVTPSKNA